MKLFQNIRIVALVLLLIGGMTMLIMGMVLNNYIMFLVGCVLAIVPTLSFGLMGVLSDISILTLIT